MVQNDEENAKKFSINNVIVQVFTITLHRNLYFLHQFLKY